MPPSLPMDSEEKGFQKGGFGTLSTLRARSLPLDALWDAIKDAFAEETIYLGYSQPARRTIPHLGPSVLLAGHSMDGMETGKQSQPFTIVSRVSELLQLGFHDHK